VIVKAKTPKYQVDFYQSACYTVSETYSSLDQALRDASTFIREIRETCTAKRGFRKVWSLRRDRKQWIEHAAFGLEAAVYIKPLGGQA
jgi:hypothetical protein